MVDGREDVPLAPSVEGGGLTLDLDGLRYPPPEPIRLPMEHSDAVLINGVASLLHVEAHWRGGLVMLLVAGVQSVSPTYTSGQSLHWIL